jgi:electron transfer flavoprotein beta subunit
MRGENTFTLSYYPIHEENMKILVCIKQIPDPDHIPGFNEYGIWEKALVSFRMNRYDEQALEEALLFKDADTSTEIHAVTIGPENSSAAAKRALEKGAAEAWHIVTGDEWLTAGETSYLIAGFARDREFDLILTGVMSEDLMQFQTGPMTAARLGIPCAVSAVNIIRADEKTFEVTCEIEGGRAERLLIKMPCLISVQTGPHRPRYPSLSNVLRAKGIPVRYPEFVMPPEGSFTGTHSGFSNPPASLKGREITGTITEKADQLIQIIHGMGLL